MILQVDDKTVRVEAAVSDTLPVSVLLGIDVACLGELLHNKDLENACAVITCAQKKRQEQYSCMQEWKRLVGDESSDFIVGDERSDCC